MFHQHPKLVAFRGYIVAVWLVLLAGCNVPEPAPVSSVAQPTNIVATASDAQVTLTWIASSGATSYNVKRAVTNGGPYALIASSSSTTYTDSSVNNGTTYYYVVSALDATGEGIDSAQATATPAAAVAPPAPPTNVAGTSGDSQATLTWTASAGATSYNVKRAAVSGGPYTQIAAPTSTTYNDTALTNGTAYYYVVSAINSLGESANSAEVSVIPSPPPPTTFGTWTNVTPSGVDLTSALCGNGGAMTVQADPAQPSNLYTEFNCQGIWRSTDYGNTWTGPINTGTNGTLVADCVGGISMSPSSTASVPTIYQSCIRGNAIGFWKSVDGGVNWTNYVVTPGGLRQDYNPPVVDPYDENHLLMTAHEFDSVVESFDGGEQWSSVPIASGMLQSIRTGFIFFVNTGNASTTRGTWLWLGEQSGGGVGTWRTANGGTTWTQVDINEHLLGTAQIYQPNNNGVIYMAGAYSTLGWGVLRSMDYGQTWAHVGMTGTLNLVFGTSNFVYSMGPSAPDPLFEVATQPGTGTWVSPNPAASFTSNSSPWQASVVNNGTSNIIVAAMGNGGLWRYIEP